MSERLIKHYSKIRNRLRDLNGGPVKSNLNRIQVIADDEVLVEHETEIATYSERIYKLTEVIVTHDVVTLRAEENDIDERHFKVIRKVLLELESENTPLLGFWKDLPRDEQLILSRWEIGFHSGEVFNQAFLVNQDLFSIGEDLFEEIYIKDIQETEYILGSYQDQDATFDHVSKAWAHAAFIKEGSLVLCQGRVARVLERSTKTMKPYGRPYSREIFNSKYKLKSVVTGKIFESRTEGISGIIRWGPHQMPTKASSVVV